MTARGEGIINVNGRETPILFTAQAIGNAEQQLQKSIGEALNDLVAGHISYNETAALLKAGMEAARLAMHDRGKPISTKDAFDLMDKAGIVSVIRVLATAISDVLTIGTEADQTGEGEDPN